MVGTSREMINHIQKNKDKVVYDIEKGVVTTEKRDSWLYMLINWIHKV